MLYTGSFEPRINLPFSYDGVGSDTHFVFFQWLLRAHEWLRWRTQLSVVQTGHMQRTTSLSSLCKCLISAYLNFLIQFHFWIDRWNFTHALVEIMSMKWFVFTCSDSFLFVFSIYQKYANYVFCLIWKRKTVSLFYGTIWTVVFYSISSLIIHNH